MQKEGLGKGIEKKNIVGGGGRYVPPKDRQRMQEDIISAATRDVLK